MKSQVPSWRRLVARLSNWAASRDGRVASRSTPSPDPSLPLDSPGSIPRQCHPLWRQVYPRWMRTMENSKCLEASQLQSRVCGRPLSLSLSLSPLKSIPDCFKVTPSSLRGNIFCSKCFTSWSYEEELRITIGEPTSRAWKFLTAVATFRNL